MWRPPNTGERVRVPTMSERETMQEIMEREREQAIATLMKANGALSRIFNLEEEDGDE